MKTVDEINSAIEDLSGPELERVVNFLVQHVESLEDEADLKDALKAIAEPGECVPWETVKRENGL